MNETLLDIAKRNLKVSKEIMKNIDDEGMFNIVAYHLQQAVELSLKHYIETQMGQDYPYTHDIGTLISIAGKDTFPEIYPWSGTITLMESKTRYVKNYRMSLDIIKDVMGLTDNLIDKISEMEHSEDLTNDSDDMHDFP